MMDSKDVSFQFSIVGETNPPSNFEEKKQFLIDIGKTFESFSKRAIIKYIVNPISQKLGKIEIKMPREDFVKHMQLLAKSIEQDFKNIINSKSEIRENSNKFEDKQSDKSEKTPFLILLTEFIGMEPKTSHFINETYRFLGKNLYFEPFQNGILTFFGTKGDFYYFVDQVFQLVNLD